MPYSETKVLYYYFIVPLFYRNTLEIGNVIELQKERNEDQK